MNQTLIALILLLTGSVRAQTVGEDGLPIGGRLDVNVTISGAAPDTDKTYVGHYGLVFTHSAAVVAEPMMKGALEVVNIRHVLDDKYDPVKLSPADWRPENFTRLRLVQLLIMPNSSSSYGTLAELIEDKKAAMEREGLNYRVHVQTDDFVGRALAPLGAYAVATDAPYCLHQDYYRSKDLTYIVTAGCREIDTLTRIQRAITDKIDAETPRPRFYPSLIHALLRDPWKLLAIFLHPGSLLLFSPLLVSMLLLPFYYLGSFGRRLFSAGAHGLGVGLTAMIVGWGAGYLGILITPVGWDASAIAMLNLLAWTLLMAQSAKIRGGAGSLDVALRILLPVTPVAIVLYYAIGSGRPMTPDEAAAAAPILAAGMSGVFCSAAGLHWGLLSKSPGAPWRKAALLFPLIISAPSASAQLVVIDGHLLTRQDIESAGPIARGRLAANGTAKTLTDAALAAAKERGEAYDLQRVEVTGMWSADDTDKARNGLFSLQIKPSFLNEESLASAPN